MTIYLLPFVIVGFYVVAKNTWLAWDSLTNDREHLRPPQLPERKPNVRLVDHIPFDQEID